MKLTHKEFKLLKIIVKSTKISIQELVDIMGLSQQTIKTSIKRINEVLITYFGFEIKMQNSNLIFPVEKRKILKMISIDLDSSIDICKNERMTYIFLQIIFERRVSITKISTELGLTRLTILSDLNDVKEELKKFNLELESIPWEGIILKGSNENIIDFSLKFLIIFFIKRLEIPYLYNIYSSLVNPKNTEYIRKFIPIDLDSKIKKVTKDLFNKLEVPLNEYLYYSFVSALIYLHVYKTFNYKSKILENETLKNKASSIYEILKNQEGLKEFINNDLDFLLCSEILLESENNSNIKFANPKFLEFISIVEEKIDLNFSDDEKSYIINILIKASLEKIFTVFAPISYSTKKSKLLIEIENNLKKDLNKVIPDISSSKAYYIFSFIKEVYLKKEPDKLKRNIFIVDCSFKNTHGKILKEQLERTYFINNISVSNFFNGIDYKNIDENYDIIIYLNALYNYKQEHKIPVYELSFIDSQKFDFENIGLIRRGL